MISSVKSWVFRLRSREVQQPPCRAALPASPAGRTPGGGTFSGPRVDAPRALWLPRYIRRCLSATLFASTTALAQFGGAQPPAPATFPDAPAATPPSPDATMAAFKYVQARVRGEEPPPAPPMSGAGVALRLEGQLVGRGWSLDGPGALAAATDMALAELQQRVPPARDAMLEGIRQKSIRNIAISLEAAGPAIPINLATYDEADLTLSPGLDGVGVKSPDAVWAVFPSTMLLSNMTPSTAFASCVAQLSGDAGLAIKGVKGHEAGQTAADKHYTFLHFRVTHLAQPSGDTTPTFLYRGSRYISSAELNTGAIKDWDAHLARAMTQRVSDGHIAPDYEFARDMESKETPGPDVNALAALALADYARATGDPAAAGAAADLLRPIISDAGALAKERRALGQASTVLAALSMLRLANAGVALSLEAEHPGAREALLSIIHLSMTNDHSWQAGTGDAERGLASWALAMVEDPAATDAIVATFRDAPGGKLMGAMPWLQYAASSQPNLPSAPAMRDLRDTLLQAQLTPEQCDQDEVGAVMFSARGSGIRPTWQSSRATLLLAGMLADDRLTSAKETLPQVSHLLSSLRYLRQLTIDDSLAWTSPDFPKAASGVRPALWELRSTPEAAALTLLAATRSLDALQAASVRLSPPAPATPAK